MRELDFSVRYPFSSAARKVLTESGMQPTDRVVELGLRRIRDALKGNLPMSGATGDVEKSEELAAYAAARMILGHMRNSFLSNKFGVEEAGRVRKYLDGANPDELDAVAQEFGISYRASGREELIPIPTYLKYSPRSREYLLITRRLVGGCVAVSRRERIRLMEEAARKHMSRMPLVRDPPEGIRDAAKALLAELPKRELPVISARPDDHPPCIAKLLEGVKKHENLNHQSRWYLAVYMIAIGMGDEALASLYANLPDYNEKVTKYQIEHARRKAYSVPSCASVTTYGLCVADCRIGSPINWHSRRGAGRGTQGAESKAQDTGHTAQEAKPETMKPSASSSPDAAHPKTQNPEPETTAEKPAKEGKTDGTP